MAGEIYVYGPYNVGDSASIVTGLSGNVLVADDITSTQEQGQITFTVVKA